MIRAMPLGQQYASSRQVCLDPPVHEALTVDHDCYDAGGCGGGQSARDPDRISGTGDMMPAYVA